VRRALALILLATVATAEGPRLTNAQRRELVEAVDEQTWRALPEWHQRVVAHRFERYLGAPSRIREKIRRKGLRKWLLAKLPPDPGRLPESLRATIEELPADVRPMATRLVFQRLRQLELDASLRRVPQTERWDVFNARFPEPYDYEKAKAAHARLKSFVVKDVAAEVGRKLAGRDVGEDEVRRIVQSKIEKEQGRVVDRVRRELFRFRGRDPRGWRRHFEARGFWLVERIRFATPRQRELIRYALRPQECPLLDLGFLGPRPEDREARRLWERDYRVFGRTELLLEARLPREIVLHLAGTGSPADFFRALQRLR